MYEDDEHEANAIVIPQEAQEMNELEREFLENADEYLKESWKEIFDVIYANKDETANCVNAWRNFIKFEEQGMV